MPTPTEKVTAIVTCFNREKEIEACLESLRWADELIVADSFSSDRTVELARRYTDKVFQHEYLSPGNQKNLAIEKASHPWVVSIDSDEVMPPSLSGEIRRTLESPRFQLYLVFRRGFFLGRELKHGGWNRDRNYLLFRRDTYRYTEEVHERLLPETDYGVFRERLIHYTHRSIDEFVKKSSRYASWGAEKYLRKGRRGRAAAIFGHAVFNFFRNYLFRLGFLDGTPGLIVALLSSYYVAEKWAKLWELERKKNSAN
jgi:glycosyltransferase involved in cell wall biosynthesis